MKKKGWLILTSLVVIIVIAVIGGKMYMDNKESKELEQERKIAVQAKGMFKDIRSLEIDKGFESSPGSKSFGVDIVQKNNNKFHVTLSLGSTSTYSTNDGIDIINYRGTTETPVITKFSNNEEETIK